MAAPLSRVFVCLSSRKAFLNARLFSGSNLQLQVKESNEQKEYGSQETHFGFQTVQEEEKEQKVHEVFANVASTYDLMNDAMSGGIHRLWKDAFLKRLSPCKGTKLLDVAGGTGDIALRYLKFVETPTNITADQDIKIPRDITAQVYMDPSEISSSSSSSSSSEGEENSDDVSSKTQTPSFMYNQEPDHNNSHVTVCDINQAMLDVGKEKALKLGYNTGISWLNGNAECLPLSDSLFDAYTIAFGIRNCTHIQQVLDEAYRVLKPGGRFMCLEFSEVKYSLLRSLYDTYSFQVIPVMGQVIAGDWKSYQYLVESIRQFPNQEDFSDMIRIAGFRMVSYENLTFGVAAIHSGFKI